MSGLSAETACLVLDLRMPGMNGLQLQQYLIETSNPVSIVFFSAHSTVDDERRALQAGAVRMLEAGPGVLAFERSLDGERVLCAFELSGQPGSLHHPEMARSEAFALIGGSVLTDTGIELAPYSFAWVRLGSN